MRHVGKLFLSLLALSLLFGCASSTNGDPPDKADDEDKQDAAADLIGKSAPDITSEFTLNGKPAKLSDLKGKVVLLDFWAVWCGPCIASFPNLRELDNDFKAKGLEMVGVTTFFEMFAFDKETKRLKQVGKRKMDENTGEVRVEGGLKPKQERDMIKDFAAHHKLKYRLILLSQKAWEQAAKDFDAKYLPTAVLIDRKGKIRMVHVGRLGDTKELSAKIKELLAEKE